MARCYKTATCYKITDNYRVEVGGGLVFDVTGGTPVRERVIQLLWFICTTKPPRIVFCTLTKYHYHNLRTHHLKGGVFFIP